MPPAIFLNYRAKAKKASSPAPYLSNSGLGLMLMEAPKEFDDPPPPPLQRNVTPAGSPVLSVRDVLNYPGAYDRVTTPNGMPIVPLRFVDADGYPISGPAPHPPTGSITPMQYGAVGDGIANDTIPVQNAAAAALAAGMWLDGLGNWYGVSECQLPVNIRGRDIKFRELNGNASDERKTVKVMGAGSGSVWLERFVIDRNGDGTRGLLNYAAGLWIERVQWVHLQGEVYGNGMGNGVTVRAYPPQPETRGFVDLYVHDQRYVHTVQDDDVVTGVNFAGCSDVWGLCSVHRQGRTDQTVFDRDAFNRGVSYSNCNNTNVYHRVTRCDQGCDVTGSGGNHGVSLAGKYSYCHSVATKVANTALACDYHRVEAEHIGYMAVIVGGGAILQVNGTQSINVSGWTARNIGSSGWARASGRTTQGARLDRNMADAIGGKFPKGCLIENFMCVSDQGSNTFTAAAGVLTIPGGIPISTGVRCQLTTTGTLPAPLALATDYFLIDVPDTFTCKLATSHINAIDGVAINTTTAGSGTHTLTLQSDCDYAVTAQETGFADTAMPNLIRPGYAIGMILGQMPSSSSLRLLSREFLYEDRTYWVRPSDGNDANSGRVDSAAGAFQTLNRALTVIAETLDIPSGRTVTVQLVDDTYPSGGAVSAPFAGGGLVIVKGNAANPSAVHISTTNAGAHCFNVGSRARLRVQDLKMSCAGANASCFIVTAFGRLEFSNVDFGVVASGSHMYTSGGWIDCLGNYSYSGGASNKHLHVQGDGKISITNRTVASSGALTFGVFAQADQGGLIWTEATTWGAAVVTGTRHSVNHNATIAGVAGNANYFPGSIAGGVTGDGSFR